MLNVNEEEAGERIARRGNRTGKNEQQECNEYLVGRRRKNT